MENLLIGLAGRKATGKSTFAKIGSEILGNAGMSSAENSYAYPLKRMLIDCFGIQEEYVFGDDKLKNKSFGTWADFFPNTIHLFPEPRLLTDKITVREIMQHLGTDIFREKIDNNFWINSFKRRYENGLFEKFNNHGTPKPAIIFVTDLRFENEVRAVNDLGGIVIKIDRFVTRENHSSEESVDLIPEELFWRTLEHEQINGINKLKLQISSILYALEIV